MHAPYTCKRSQTVRNQGGTYNLTPRPRCMPPPALLHSLMLIAISPLSPCCGFYLWRYTAATYNCIVPCRAGLSRLVVRVSLLHTKNKPATCGTVHAAL